MEKLSNRQFREIFDAAASQYDSVVSPYAGRRRIEFVVKRARGRCLEVGAGTGEISHAISKNHEVTATDISPKMVEEIQKKLKIPSLACDAEELPFPDASFDTVIGSEMIYYLDNPDRFLAEANRVLRKDGALIITSASRAAYLYDRARAFLRFFGIGHTYFEDHMRHFPGAGYLRRLIGTAGFHIEETKRFIVVPFEGFDLLNRILEKTPLKYMAAFVGIGARKI